MKWTSVKERKPKDGQQILVIMKSNALDRRMKMNTYWITEAAYCESDEWVYLAVMPYLEGRKPVFWMPMPKMPKEIERQLLPDDI